MNKERPDESIGYWLVFPKNRNFHPFPLSSNPDLTTNEAYIAATIHNNGKEVHKVVWIPDQNISDWIAPTNSKLKKSGKRK